MTVVVAKDLLYVHLHTVGPVGTRLGVPLPFKVVKLVTSIGDNLDQTFLATQIRQIF